MTTSHDVGGHEPPTTHLTARTPEDLLALVPIVLGFVPRESVVMLTFGSGRPFHARVDLPRGPDELAQVVEVLRRPAVSHRVRRVVFVVYAARARPATRAAQALGTAFRAAGIDVLEVLRADGRRWWSLVARSATPSVGVPYDVTAHPFVAQAVLDGRVTLASRDELAATVESRPERVADLQRALGELPRWGREPSAESRWVRDLVRGHVATGEVPADPDAARLLLALADPATFSSVGCLMSRAGATAHVTLWSDLVRRAPDRLLAAPASLLAFAAWLAGNGALSWCAVDRCLAAEPGHQPGHGLGTHVAGLLLDAVPPQVWDDARAAVRAAEEEA